MSNLQRRIDQLEAKHAQAEKNLFIVEYGEDGRAISPSSKELLGMTESEVTAFLRNLQNVTLIRVVHDEEGVLNHDNSE